MRTARAARMGQGTQIARRENAHARMTRGRTEVPSPDARPTQVGETVNGYVKLPSGRIHQVVGIVTNAVAYFVAAWLGRKARREALANHVAKVSRKMFEAPEFFYYAIADGLRWLFVRHGRWRGPDCAREERGDLQMEFELLTG